MNRQDATNLIQRYKDFPYTKIFGIRPYNYPLFHLLECFSKGWQVERMNLHSYGWTIDRMRDNDMPFEHLATQLQDGQNEIWSLVARNPMITRGTFGFVQEDLYARYVGKCNPLKSSQTTWCYTPFDAVQQNTRFRGNIGQHTPLYLLEIDLDTTEILGERINGVPWHYLQQTIQWKPYTDRIDWNIGVDQQP